MLKNILFCSVILFGFNACSTVTLSEPKCQIKNVRTKVDVTDFEVCEVKVE